MRAKKLAVWRIITLMEKAKDKTKKSFTHGALSLCVFLALGKIIGAVYRLPLTWILGAVGIGTYQMIFPLYSLLLTLSSSSVPQALAKIISAKRAKGDVVGVRQTFLSASIWLVILSGLATGLVMLFARPFAALQGNADAFICFFGIAPAILFVGIIAAYRGYFQGNENMTPSGVSSLIEQVVKMAAGLFLAYLFRPRGVYWSVFGALLGVSISELVAANFLAIRFLCDKGRPRLNLGNLNFKCCSKKIFAICLPATLGGLIMPLVQFIDSGLVVNLLDGIGFSHDVSVAMFGVSSGAVGSLINLPVVVSLAIATAALPSISKNNELNCNEKVKATIDKSWTLTLFFSVPCAVGLALLSRPIMGLLYGKVLSNTELTAASGLLKIGAISIIFLALTQVASGVCQGLGKFKIPLFGLILGGSIKIIANLCLIRVPNINIYGDQIANILCFFTSAAFDFAFIVRFFTISTLKNTLKIAFLAAVMAMFVIIFDYFVDINNFIWLCVCILGAVIIYFALATIIFKKHEKNSAMIKGRQKTK